MVVVITRWPPKIRQAPLGSLRVLAFDGRLPGSSRADDARPDDARRSPLIVANPPGDAEFRGLIDRILLAGPVGPHDLQAALRARYPQAVVRRRDLAYEALEVWYVYRDGHWIRSEEHA